MNYYNIDDLKKLFFSYFVNECGHKKISGYSLVPKVDDSVLFTPAGMHPLIPYLTGKCKHPVGNKLVNIQGVVRTGAIDKVGVDSYLTFFELFGAWIMDDYSKYDTLLKIWNFFISKKYLDIQKEQIYVTYFKGNKLLPEDYDTLNIWKKIGVDDSHLFSTEKNWKGPYSSSRICGPNTRIYFDTGKKKCCPDCNVLCSCGKYVELWDIVFFYYILKDNTLKENPYACVDMGAGVERIATLVQNVKTIYETDILNKIVEVIKQLETKNVNCNLEELTRKQRIVADHLRCACFIVGDDVPTLTSNKGRGYVLRKIIRRAINNLEQLGLNLDSYKLIINEIIDLYKGDYPVLYEKRNYIVEQLCTEYSVYKLNLKRNLIQVEKYLNGREFVTKAEVKKLFDRYGVPTDYIMDITSKRKVLIKE